VANGAAHRIVPQKSLIAMPQHQFECWNFSSAGDVSVLLNSAYLNEAASLRLAALS
jgi:hypothetical protein